jgi:S1-C subfamily serine protease
MKLIRSFACPAAVLTALLLPLVAQAQAPFAKVRADVNKKLVKLYGAGGFRSLTSWGTGVLISADGYILTVDSTMLDTENLRVHLYDGRSFQNAKVIARDPELDVALVKIDKVDDLPFYDIPQAAKQPLAATGDWILGFSNQFHIATRDEPMSVQRGVIASYTTLNARRGTFEFPYTGKVYVIDAITNNPGAGGGALTTRKGELLGIIGKELRNTQTDTWMNYAMPIQSLAKFVEEAKTGKFKPKERPKVVAGQGGFHGITMVPSPGGLRTPPYVEEVAPGSPAAKAGIKPDDLIIYIEGEQVVSTKAFRDIMDKYRPGMKVKLDVQRVVDKRTKAEQLITIELEVVQPVVKAPPTKK